MINFLKSYSVNLLSLLNIIFNFLFTLIFGYFYKVSHIADSYFLSLIIYNNIFVIVQLFYSTFFNVYLYIEDEKKRDNLYYLLLIILIIISTLIITIYFIITSSFTILSVDTKKYLDIYVFTLFFTPLVGISIQLMNAKKEFFYAYYYTIGRSLVATILVLINKYKQDLSFLAYGYLIYDFLFFLLIFNKSTKLLQFKIPYFDKETVSIVMQKSFLDKAGQFLVGLPELFISNILTHNFPGILSIYSYIKKFTTSLTQFIFIPQFTIFSTNIANFLREKNINAILNGMKKLWKKTVPLYLLNSIILAIVIKYILQIFLDNSYVEENIFNIYAIYVILLIQNIFIMLEYPFGIVINQKLLFSYALKVKALSFIIFIIFLFSYKMYMNNLYILLLLFMPSILFMFIAYRRKTLNILQAIGEKNA